ncbi:hypothetical protein ABEB36_003765 [Hypothenemus hampei]|uniref:Uncharacterized protein n=1 Tax=Hypothenemus hampei TaxID=57062 RepID=A0ABD1F139_HYPHA
MITITNNKVTNHQRGLGLLSDRNTIFLLNIFLPDSTGVGTTISHLTMSFTGSVHSTDNHFIPFAFNACAKLKFKQI